MPSAAALQEACRLIAASSAAGALSVAFQCGMPGFVVPLASAVWEQVRIISCLLCRARQHWVRDA